jgi:hypothetical protein
MEIPSGYVKTAIEAMAHVVRWLTVLKDGDFLEQTVSLPEGKRCE